MESKKNAARRKARRALEIAVTIIFELAAAAAAGAAAGMKLIPYAYEERGYFAIGGEWLLMLAIAAGAWYAAHKLDAEVWEGRRNTHEDLNQLYTGPDRCGVCYSLRESGAKTGIYRVQVRRCKRGTPEATVSRSTHR